MKKVTLVLLAVAVVFTMSALAQIGSPTTDVLGAHLNYGRGCAACHAPHSGARGNGIATTDTTTGNIALWGQDVAAAVRQVHDHGPERARKLYAYSAFDLERSRSGHHQHDDLP